MKIEIFGVGERETRPKLTKIGMLFENRSANQIRRGREDPGTPHGRLPGILNGLSRFHFIPGAYGWRTLLSRIRYWDEYGTTAPGAQVKTVINNSRVYAPSGSALQPATGFEADGRGSWNALGARAS